MTWDQKTAVLRTIDKVDKLGVAGVVELLQKPPEEFGADLDPVRAAFFGMFLSAGSDGAADNARTLETLRDMGARAALIGGRLALMCAMDETVVDEDGTTAWDRFLAMPPNTDNTWSGEGRPANIGWALDDLCGAFGNNIPDRQPYPLDAASEAPYRLNASGSANTRA